MRRVLLFCLAVGAALFALAGCGGGGSSSSSTAGSSTASAEPTDAQTASSSGGSGGGVEEAAAKVAAMRAAPGPLEIPAMTKSPPTGKTAYWISCKLPECDAGDPGMEAAMKTLGWKLTTLKADLTPEAYAGAWSQAVAAKPDVIFATDLVPVQIIEAQLKQAQAQGTSVVMVGGATKVGEGGVDGSVGSVPWIGENGVALTDWAIADSEGKANILVLYDPSVSTHVAAYEEGKEEAEKICPECTVSGMKVQLAEAGKGVPAEVVSYLQTHPEVEYVIAGVSSLELGLGQAIKSAGLPVKVGTAASSPQDLEAVKDGTESVAVTNELSSLAWRMADVAARIEAGEKVPSSIANPVGVRQLFDEQNIESADFVKPWEVPDVEKTFAKAWGRGE
jgi:ribose transport system substrate-binding protein